MEYRESFSFDNHLILPISRSNCIRFHQCLDRGILLIPTLAVCREHALRYFFHCNAFLDVQVDLG